MITLTTPPRTVLITGGNRGLGLACAHAALERGPLHVILACRDATLGEHAAAALRRDFPASRISVIPLDLASLDAVNAAALTLRATLTDPVDALVCNAGTWPQSDRQRSPDGYELAFATNHLGHAALILGLLPHLAPDGRIVLVSSALHDPTIWKGGPAVHYPSAQGVAHPEQDAHRDASDAAAGARAYATSKLCNVLFSAELARQLHARGSAVTVNAFNPGLMAGTGLNRGAPLRSRLVWQYVLPLVSRFIPGAFRPEESGETLAALALDARYAGVSGRYFGTRHEETPSPDARDPLKAADLWAFTRHALERPSVP